MTAVAVAAGLAAWLALDAGDAGAWAGTSLGAVGVAGVALATALRRPALLAGATLVLGAEYAALLAADDPPLDTRAPLVAAALLLVAELVAWSHELRSTSEDEAGAYGRRAAWLSLEAVGALAVGAVMIAVVDLASTGGVAIEVVGALAALTALVLLQLLARPAGGERRETL